MVWNVDPILFHLGPFVVRWYSLLFAGGFLTGYFVLRRMFAAEGRDTEIVDTLLVYLVIATIVGARLGQVLFYEPGYYFSHPIEIFETWKGGLASHGGFAAVLLAIVIFCRRHREFTFLSLTDRLTVPIMLVAGFIRIGNLFNSEIIGRATTLPWAVVFARVDAVPRHPTQIYEALGYFATSLILYLTYRAAARRPPAGRLLGMAMVLGFGWRFFVEFFKVYQESFEASLPLDMGQLLSIPFILAGLFLILRARSQKTAAPAVESRPRGVK